MRKPCRREDLYLGLLHCKQIAEPGIPPSNVWVWNPCLETPAPACDILLPIKKTGSEKSHLHQTFKVIVIYINDFLKCVFGRLVLGYKGGQHVRQCSAWYVLTLTLVLWLLLHLLCLFVDSALWMGPGSYSISLPSPDPYPYLRW